MAKKQIFKCLISKISTFNSKYMIKNCFVIKVKTKIFLEKNQLL